MSEPFGIPIDVVILVIVGIPFAIALFLGVAAFRQVETLLYRCQRCGHEFGRPAHRAFPRACPRCHARDWNLQ